MTRSLWKGPFSEIKKPKEINQKNLLQKKTVWSRRSMILPANIGNDFLIHNGKNFIPLRVDIGMVGHRFGEFSNTRKKPIHKTNKKKGTVAKKK